MSLGGTCLLFLQPVRSIFIFNLFDWGKIFLLSFLQIFLSFNCEAWALQYVSIAKAQLLYNLTPFLSALLMSRKKRLSILQWSCISLACIGSLSGINLMRSLVTFSWPEAVMFMAVLSGAAGWIQFKELLQKGYSPHFLNGITMFIGGLFSWFLCWILKVPIQIKSPKEVFGSIVFLVLISNFLFYGLYSKALKHNSPTLLALLGQFTPFFSALYSKIWFEETLPDHFIWNVFLTIFATFLFQMEEKRLWGRSDSN